MRHTLLKIVLQRIQSILLILRNYEIIPPVFLSLLGLNVMYRLLHVVFILVWMITRSTLICRRNCNSSRVGELGYVIGELSYVEKIKGRKFRSVEMRLSSKNCRNTLPTSLQITLPPLNMRANKSASSRML